jgi:hypothetical protein
MGVLFFVLRSFLPLERNETFSLTYRIFLYKG